MTYSEPSESHRSAVEQVAEARQQALEGVSAIRRVTDKLDHAHLVRASGNETRIAVEATQAVLDYLLQLRPYRQNAQTWDLGFGRIELPRVVSEENPGLGRGWTHYFAAQDPVLEVETLGDMIENMNETIVYAAKTPPSVGSAGGGRAMTADSRAREIRREVARGEYTPPDVGPDAERRLYKFVLQQHELLALVQAADDVAAEVDLLADIESPDFGADGGGVV